MRRYLDQRLKLRHMRVVDAIATHGSLQKAAVSLGQTQPALTKTLREIETVLGVRIFERYARGVAPNRYGELVAAAARRILAEARRLDSELDALGSAASGVVVIGALPVAASGILPGVLGRLRAQHPDLVVRLNQGTTEQLLPALAHGDVELVVGRLYEPARPDAFLREAIYDEPIAVLARAGHPLLAGGPVSTASLSAYPLVLPTIGQLVGQDIETLLARLGLVTGGSTLRSSSVGLIREVLLTSDALTVIPSPMLAGDIVRGTVCVLPIRFDAPPRPAGLILVPGRVLSPAADAFIACLRACAAEAAAERGAMPVSNRSRR